MAHPFKAMSEDEVAGFLAESRNAIIAVNRDKGAALISPVWYLYEDESLYFSVTKDSAKYRHLTRDPKVSVCIDGGHPDERAVTIYGGAELFENERDWPDDVLWRTGCRYTEQHDFLRQYLETIKDDTVLVKVNCTKLVARDYNH